MAENLGREQQLISLDETDEFDIAPGEPDPTGWDVVASDGKTIGDVDQLIVDVQSMKVRYLDCTLLQEDRHILVPIGLARLDEEGEQVMVDTLSSADLSSLPEYVGQPITPEFEEEVHTASGSVRGARPASAEAGEVRLTRSEEELAVGKRDVSAGEVDVEKHVETEHVKKPVRRRHEEVDIERRPATGMRAGEARIEEEEIRVPLSEEELVVDKRPEVKEELVVRKRPVEEEAEVEADLKRERVDIEQHGDLEEEEEDFGRGKRR